MVSSTAMAGMGSERSERELAYPNAWPAWKVGRTCFLMMSPIKNTMMPTNAGRAALATAMVGDTAASR